MTDSDADKCSIEAGAMHIGIGAASGALRAACTTAMLEAKLTLIVTGTTSTSIYFVPPIMHRALYTLYREDALQTPLNASASTAGALLSSSIFEVPQFQREYSWQEDEISDFWNDLSGSLEADSYFLGLVILTDEGGKKHVVDGQQRLITLSLLANAIYFEALDRGRTALADRIRADFLRSIDYDSDDTDPRVVLSDEADNTTFQAILENGKIAVDTGEEGSVSRRLAQSYMFLKGRLQDDLKKDSFKRLGKWTEFLTHRVYFAVFIHPDPSSAYQVYEVINTRGRELTTADLLKNYILSQTPNAQRETRYSQWQEISGQFLPDGSNTFVQYIRHSITVRNGHILPKDLFGFLAQRVTHAGKKPPSPNELMKLLKGYLPLYLQMIDPTIAGPADPDALKIFEALNALSVIAVRPILLAIAEAKNPLEGMRYILRLVVRRIVVGNLGTGNVERRFGEVAKKIHDAGNWKVMVDDLRDLNPSRDEFVGQLARRSFNKGVLGFLRRSILSDSITPDAFGVLHFVRPRQAAEWRGMSEEDTAFWGSTIGNTFLADLDRRPKAASSWKGFKDSMLPHAADGEWRKRLEKIDVWSDAAVERIGKDLANTAGNIWFADE